MKCSHGLVLSENLPGLFGLQKNVPAELAFEEILQVSYDLRAMAERVFVGWTFMSVAWP